MAINSIHPMITSNPCYFPRRNKSDASATNYPHWSRACFGREINANTGECMLAYARFVECIWWTVYMHITPASTYIQDRCQYHSLCVLEPEYTSPHFSPSRLSLCVTVTLSREGTSLKIYTAHRLMNHRETGGRGDEGRDRDGWKKKRRKGGQREVRRWGMRASWASGVKYGQ